MVDLQTQYEFIKDQVDSTVLDIFKRGTFINGPTVNEFQSDLEKYLNVKHVIPCANGTDALQIALMSLGLKPGDEIITSDFTFAATVEVIALLQLKPVLVDIEENTFNINCEEILKSITPKTKAIIPVHLFGQIANMEEVIKIAKNVKPSPRGELEITSINSDYLIKKRLRVQLFGRGFAWLDTGTPDSLSEAGEFVKALEKRQGLKIGCIEENCLEKGFVSKKDVLKLSKELSNTDYGQYLIQRAKKWKWWIHSHY